MSRSDSQLGLTLVELIIALAIFTIIAGTAYSGLMQILRAQRTLLDQRDIQTMASAVVGRLSRELQLATTSTRLLPPDGTGKKVYPPTVNLLGTHGKAGADNSGDTITFVADDAGQYVPDGKTHTGIVQITYRMEKIPNEDNPTEEDVNYLIRDEIPIISPVEKALKARMTFPVTDRLVSLKFRYFDIDQKKWVDEWTEKQPGLPGIVSFTIQIRSPLGKVHTFSSDLALKRKGSL